MRSEKVGGNIKWADVSCLRYKSFIVVKKMILSRVVFYKVNVSFKTVNAADFNE